MIQKMYAQPYIEKERIDDKADGVRCYQLKNVLEGYVEFFVLFL